MNVRFISKLLNQASVASCFLLAAVYAGYGGQSNIVSDAPSASLTDTQEVLRAYLRVQEQLQTMQATLEHSQQDARDIAARNVKELADRLRDIETAVGNQRAAELQAVRSSNRFMLIVTGALVLLGGLIISFVYLQWRAMRRINEVAVGFQNQLQQGSAHASAFIEAGEPRLLHVMERLEKRIVELEHTNPLSLNAGEGMSATLTYGISENGSTPAAAGKADPNEQMAVLLNKGQSLMSLAQYDAAMRCFDEVLAVNPTNTEALIKKGTALEKMDRLDDAVACYDQAIAADASVTLAYLYKGGVFNRMERHDEALECYEKALKTQEKNGKA